MSVATVSGSIGRYTPTASPSPMLVVAYALAGRIDFDFHSEPS